MRAERRKQVLLFALLVALAVVVYRADWTPPAPPGAAADRPGRAVRGGDGAVVSAEEVRLDALNADRPTPKGNGRNLFRFGQPVRAVQAPQAPAPPPLPSASFGRAPAAAVERFPLRFIGLVESGDGSSRTAVLADDYGVYRGREGEVVAGRYRVVAVGIESVELLDLSGGRRETLRFTQQ
jgi:hypothetical protein